MNGRCRWILVGLVGLIAAGDPAADGPLNLADIADLHAALQAEIGANPPGLATFRDLWDRPREFQGRQVRIEGDVRRLFHQGARGQLPALVEVWLTTPSGDLFCLICPESTPVIGSRVSFVGTYLKRIEYRAGDVPRLAPLVVGPAPPTALKPAQAAARPAPRDWELDRALGVGAVLVLVMALLRNYARRPPPPRPDLGPAPLFVDGERSGADDPPSPDDSDEDGLPMRRP